VRCFPYLTFHALTFPPTISLLAPLCVVVELLAQLLHFYRLELPFESLLVCKISPLGYQHFGELVLDPKHAHVLLALFLHKQQQMHRIRGLFFVLTQDVLQ